MSIIRAPSPCGSPVVVWSAAASAVTVTTFAYHAAENPVHVHDLQATLLHLCGIQRECFTCRHQGLDFRLTGVEPSKVVKGILA